MKVLFPYFLGQGGRWEISPSLKLTVIATLRIANYSTSDQSEDRRPAFHSVENRYISLFNVLGSTGRNLAERKDELAMLHTIAPSFNALWNVEKTRPFFQRFVIYWTMVTVGPVLIALSFSLTTPARLGAIVEMVGATRPDPSVVGLALAQLNWLFTWAGMTLLYVIMPNTRVRWDSALGGGFLAAVLWELGKALFTWASATLFDYGAVYGSLGALLAASQIVVPGSASITAPSGQISSCGKIII